MSRPTRETAAGRAYLDLQNRARRERRRTQDLLTMYVVERWLARMSTSPYAGDFVLKGGMLLASFGSRRPTTDADALARNTPAEQSAVAARVVEIARLSDLDDGIIYLPETVKAAMIRDDALYSGVRVTMDATLGTARLKLKLGHQLRRSGHAGAISDRAPCAATRRRAGAALGLSDRNRAG